MNEQNLALAFASVNVDLGVHNFETELQLSKERAVGIKFTNSTENDVKLTICKSFFKQGDGEVITDGTVSGVVVACTNSGYSVDQFIAHCLEYATRVPLTLIRTNNPFQFTQSIVVREKGLGSNPTPWSIDLSHFIDPKNPNENVLQVNQLMQFDKETEIEITIPARLAAGQPTISTFTFNCGGINNPDKGLNEIAKLAGAAHS